MFKKLLLISTFAVIFLSFSLPALADQTPLTEHACLYNGVVTMDCIPPLFANLVYWLIVLSGTVAVFFIIYGGIKFLTSGGAQDKVAGAKKTITWSIIGLVVILSSFMIVNIIADLTGVNCITEFGFTSCGLDKKSACGTGGEFGTCGANKVCVSVNGSFSCEPLCSKDHPSGYCLPPKECIRKDNAVYNCDNYCGNKFPNGWCEIGKCTKTSTVPPQYKCK